MLKAGVIGCGYWGPNIIRNLDALPEVELIYVADLNTEQLAKQKALYPYIKTTTNYLDIIMDPAIDLVLIVTPVNYPLSICKRSPH